MSVERTYSMIKPDAVAAGNVGNILAMIESAGYRIVALRKLGMTGEQAQRFYEVHKERGFYQDLVSFMTQGPIVAMVLEKENAIADLRQLMGATNPANAEEGTIRRKYAENIERNAIHGSDGPDTAKEEVNFFFSSSELL